MKLDLAPWAMCLLGVLIGAGAVYAWLESSNMEIHKAQEACRSYNAAACFEVAQAYEAGEELELNPKEAYRVYELACKLRHAGACLRLKELKELYAKKNGVQSTVTTAAAGYPRGTGKGAAVAAVSSGPGVASAEAEVIPDAALPPAKRQIVAAKRTTPVPQHSAPPAAALPPGSSQPAAAAAATIAAASAVAQHSAIPEAALPPGSRRAVLTEPPSPTPSQLQHAPVKRHWRKPPCTDGESCFQVAQSVLNGYGDYMFIPDLEAKAEAYFTQSCDFGYAESCYLLALNSLQHPQHALIDSARSLGLFEKACTLGQGAACTRLGEVYKLGELNQEADNLKAAEFYDKGCTLGNGGGCCRLGTAYAQGKLGFMPDHKKACELYRKFLKSETGSDYCQRTVLQQLCSDKL